MFEISIQREFCAAHALLIGGHREIMHGHNWRVTVVIAGGNLDADGLLCDFHTAEDVLSEVVGPFNNANLNECPPFVNGVNPSAEHIATDAGKPARFTAGRCRVCDEGTFRAYSTACRGRRVPRVAFLRA